MFRRLSRNFSSNDLHADYKTFKPNTNKIATPGKNEYPESNATNNNQELKTEGSTMSSSNWICRRCFNKKLNELAFEKTMISETPKDKLNRSFSMVNQFSFQDQIQALHKDKVNKKVNARIDSSNQVWSGLTQYYTNNPSRVENLQKQNQHSSDPLSFVNSKDTRYEKVKQRYDLKEKYLKDNMKWYHFNQPRKEIEDYYSKCQFDVPVLEPRYYVDEGYKRNFVKELQNQINQRREREEKEKQAGKDAEGIANDRYNQYLSRYNKGALDQKLRAQKKLYNENQEMWKQKEIKKLREEREQKDHEKVLNDAYTKRLQAEEIEKANKKMNDIQQLRDWTEEHIKMKEDSLKNQELEKKKWNDYIEEFEVRCIHGNKYEKCAWCNRSFPRNQLIKNVFNKDCWKKTLNKGESNAKGQLNLSTTNQSKYEGNEPWQKWNKSTRWDKPREWNNNYNLERRRSYSNTRSNRSGNNSRQNTINNNNAIKP